MEVSKNNSIIIDGADGKKISADVSFLPDGISKPVIIFSHGFKDFKDWGHYNEMATEFAKAGYYFIKLNFSHNGTTINSPDKIVDFEAFSNNNFSKELMDLNLLINWIIDSDLDREEKNLERIFLLGHSRGGGISIIKAKEDSRIKKIATWGAPVNFENKIPAQAMEYWKNNGTIYVENSRTKEQLPLKYQIAEDYFNNIDRINVLKATKNITIPFLLVHGTQDEVVNVKEAKIMKKANNKVELFLIENTDHYFGITYPYKKNSFTREFKTVMDQTILFFKK